jgi:putative intracellular protease/amidase
MKSDAIALRAERATLDHPVVALCASTAILGASLAILLWRFRGG